MAWRNLAAPTDTAGFPPVSVPHGHAGANVNLLTSKDDIDLVTGMTRYSGVPVSLRPA